MPQCASHSKTKLDRCEEILKWNAKNRPRSELLKVPVPRHVTILRGFSEIGNLEPSCGGNDDSDPDLFANRDNSLPSFNEDKVMGSFEAQIEFLRHELFLCRNQVQERNKQVEKLESLVQHHYEKMNHNCEGSDNLVKVIELLLEAVELQNTQIRDLSDLKQKISHLGNEPRARHCGGKSRLEKPELKQGCCHKTYHSTRSNAGYQSSNGALEAELEKQKSINCQLNENTRRLEEDIRSLKSKLDEIEAEKVSSTKLLCTTEQEKQSMLKQIKVFKEQNKKLSNNISKLDEERDRMVKELNHSDETIEKLKAEVGNLTKQLNVYEVQCESSSEKNNKLQKLLANSEKIVETVNRQKLDISKELGETNGRLLELQKSYQSLKLKYQETSRQLKKVKKDYVKANEEKALIQSQLQEYVSKVRQIEDLLLHKEQEREFLFEQFKELTARECSKTPLMSANDGMDVESALEEEEDSISKNVPAHNKADVVIQTDFITDLPQHVQQELSNSSRIADTLQRELTLEKKTCNKLHGIIKTTRQEAMEANSKNELLTEQLELMANNVHHLESQVKTISQSLDMYRRECMEQEQHRHRLDRELVRERFQRARSESSHSTML